MYENQNSRTTKAVRIMIWTMGNRIVSIVCPFVVRTIFIRIFTAEYLGLNSLFSSVLQVLSLSELGFGSAMVFSMYKPLAEKDIKMVCALLALYNKIYKIMGFAMLGIGILITPFLKNIIAGDYPKDVNIYILYYIYIANTCISYFTFAYKDALFEADQRADINNKIAVVSSLLMYLYQAVILITTRNYYAYIIALPVLTFVNNLVKQIISKKMYPQYVCRGKINKQESTNIKKRVFGMALNKISITTRNSFDSIFISMFVGLTILGKYTNYYYILNSVLMVVSIVTKSILAGIGNSIAQESVEKNYNDFKKFLLFISWLAAICVACLTCLYQPFMLIWAGKDNLFPISIMLIFVIYYYIKEIANTIIVYRDATGLWWEGRTMPIVDTVINIILNYMLGKLFGVSGILVATIISIGFITIPWSTIIVFKNYFKMRPTKYFIRVAFNMLLTFLGTLIAYLLCSLIPVNGIIELFVNGIIAVVISFLIFFVVYHNSKEFKELKKMFIRILRH